MKLHEGDVVWCESTIKVEEKRTVQGTIIWIIGDDIFVLCTEGYLHKRMFNEIWKDKE